mmetsp:Transcript_91319/g.200045  ORF Transcript_91319/g.200045 Transcript_91319/m.200045 type:complete len:140 (+) Transcript_91319:1618-2037(+)
MTEMYSCRGSVKDFFFFVVVVVAASAKFRRGPKQPSSSSSSMSRNRGRLMRRAAAAMFVVRHERRRGNQLYNKQVLCFTVRMLTSELATKCDTGVFVGGEMVEDDDVGVVDKSAATLERALSAPQAEKAPHRCQLAPTG